MIRLQYMGLATLALIMLPGTHAWAADDAGDVAFGEYLSGQCVTCHQISGASDGIPPIVGWDTTSFFQVMDTYRQKARENKAMQTIAASLSDQDIKSLAAYFATIEPKED